MVKTIKQLEREIAQQRKQVAKEKQLSQVISRKRELSSELIRLKNRRLIATGSKSKRLLKRFGKGLLKTGSKVGKAIGPAVKKQARLIRDQQLRDDAIFRARQKSAKKISRGPTRKTRKKPRSGGGLGSDIFGNLDF